MRYHLTRVLSIVRDGHVPAPKLLRPSFTSPRSVELINMAINPHKTRPQRIVTQQLARNGYYSHMQKYQPQSDICPSDNFAFNYA